MRLVVSLLGGPGARASGFGFSGLRKLVNGGKRGHYYVACGY